LLSPRASHALLQSAFFYEILFQSPDLLVKQIIGLVDETNRDIGYDFG
jgi:hypothetical protein